MRSAPDMVLPPGWSECTLGDVTEAAVEQSGPPDKGEFIYVDISAVDAERKRITDPRRLAVSQAPSRARQRLRHGDVLVSMTRPNLNAVAPVTEELHGAIGSTGFHVLRARAVEPKWLLYAVQRESFVEELVSLTQGALYPAVRPKDIRSQRLPIPPLAEQRRIIAALEEHLSDLEAAEANVTHARHSLRRLREGLLQSAVDGRMTSPSSVALRGDSDVSTPVLPQHWRWATVAELALTVEYGTSAKTTDDPDGVPVLRMGNLQDGEIRMDTLKYLPNAHAEFPDLLLQDGDVLFNRTNSPELVGKSAVFRSSGRPVSFASYLLRVKCKPEILPDILAGYVNSRYGRSWISTVVSQQVGQANVNGSKLRALRVPVPPLSEQHAIVARLRHHMEQCRRAAREFDVQLARSARLRQSVLQAAFDGKLVPQSPHDEPALVLLDRLRAEAASSAPATKAPRAKPRARASR